MDEWTCEVADDDEPLAEDLIPPNELVEPLILPWEQCPNGQG